MKKASKRRERPLSIKLLFFIATFFASMSMYAQGGITVTGTVADDMGELPGVSVAIKGSTTGVFTDVDGKYSINVKDDKTVLVFSFIGYESQSIIVGNKRVIDVDLKSVSSDLDEVVVIGYGTARKKDLTGATASVKGSEIRQVPVTTAAQALTGKVAGVNVVTQSGAPGADINITVRGGTSITQSNKPLYIVDGFQMDDGLRNIDINDIESIDVMKDASATAIYGARGSNGVILITTKTGKTGKTEVSYNGYVSFEKLGKKLDLLNTEQYVKYQYDLQALGGSQAKWADMFGGGNPNDPSFYTGVYDYISKEYGNRAGIDWQEEVFGGTAVLQNHNVSITGGNEKTKFMLSYNYTGQDGLVAKSGYNKNSIRTRINHELNKRMRFDFSSSFQDTEVEGGGSLGGMLKMTILQPATGGTRYTNEQMLHTDLGDEMLSLDSQYDINNPIITNDAITQKKYTRQVVLNAGLDIDILKDLTFRTAGSYTWQQVRNDTWDDGRTRTAKNLLGPYGKRNNSEKKTWQITNTLSWKKSFGAHNLNALLGHEVWYNESMKLDNTYYEFPNSNFGLNDVSMAKRVVYESGKSKNGLVSMFSRLMYNYNHRYLLSATLRYDGSSKFIRGKQWGTLPSVSGAWRISEESFMQNQDILSNLKVRIGYGTTGNCNIDDNMYVTDYGSVLYAINNAYVNGLKPSSKLGNPLLVWEKTTSTNIGLDVSFFNNRVNLTADYYNNMSDNLLIENDIPSSSGYTKQFQNSASIRNRGFEFVLNTMNVVSKDFTWSTDFNISFNRSKVVKLFSDDITSFRKNLSSRIDFWIEEGQPLGQFFGYIYDGVYTTQDFTQNADGTYSLNDGVAYLKGRNKAAIKPGDVKYKTTAGQTDEAGNPVWSTDDRTIIGNAEPKFTGGMTNNFMYKGFDFSVFFTFSQGNEVFNMNSQRFYGPYLPNQNSLSSMANYYALIDPITGQESTNLNRLAEMNPNQHSKSALWSLHSDNKIATTDALDYYLEDASYLRINTITLGYTLPKHLTKKAWLSNARIYCTLNNVHTFTGYSGYDPEVSASSSGLTPGVDNSAYPKSKSYVIGVNLTF